MKLGLNLLYWGLGATPRCLPRSRVGTLLVNAMGSSVEDRLGQMRILAELAG